jgi:hypothetical protein
VWEWCADTFNPHAHHYAATGQPAPQPHPDAPRVLRGGSYLCHDSYCNPRRESASGSSGHRAEPGVAHGPIGGVLGASVLLIILGTLVPVLAWSTWGTVERAMRNGTPLPGSRVSLPVGVGVTFVGILVALSIVLS